jgi:hypothetical protein
MVLVVMQPTYLPWMGYFDLIDQSDVFIFLDTVQFEKQSWQQRNRIKTPQGTHWLTVPVFHAETQPIIQARIVQIKSIGSWRRKHWLSLLSNYQKAPFWSEFGPSFEQLYQRKHEKLAELNIDLINMLCEAIGIRAKFVRTSELPPLSGKKAEPLVALCKMFGADVYLSPAGSQAYLESDVLFWKNGTSLLFQQYEHPKYPQLYGEFIPYLSVVDLMMNAGPKALEIIRSGRRPNKTLSEMPGVSLQVEPEKTDGLKRITHV